MLKNNSKKDLIWDAIANYETQITGNISGAVGSLGCYGFTREDVIEEYKSYFKMCVDNNNF